MKTAWHDLPQVTFDSDGIAVPAAVVNDYGDTLEVIPLYWRNYPAEHQPIWEQFYGHKSVGELSTVLINKSSLI